MRSGIIRLNGRSLIKFDLLVERFDVSDGTFIPVLYKPKEAVGNDSLFRTTSSGTQRALTEVRIGKPK